MMKPWCMSRGRGGSALKGCLPVNRIMEGFRSTQLSDVNSSLESRTEGSSSILPFFIGKMYSDTSFSSSSEESTSGTILVLLVTDLGKLQLRIGESGRWWDGGLGLKKLFSRWLN